jgi:hypothetical protein
VRLPRIEERFLLWAAEHPDELVRGEVAGHNKTPAKVLSSMLHDPSVVVLRRLSKNIKTPQVILLALGQHPDASLRRNLINNKTSPAFLLQWFATSMENGLGHLARQMLKERAKK